MNDTIVVLFAASIAAAMALLVRDGASPSLRAAIRTSAVLLLGWSLAYRAHRPIPWLSLTWRVWLMFAISFLAVGLAWGLHFRDTRLAEPSPVALADRINVFIAVACAVLLILGSSPQRYVLAVLLVSGAVVLASKRG